MDRPLKFIGGQNIVKMATLPQQTNYRFGVDFIKIQITFSIEIKRNTVLRVSQYLISNHIITEQ